MAEPFRYDRYQSPYVQSISSMIAGQNDARARALEIGGNAQAAAAQQSGAAWAGAAQNIGQSIAAIPGQIQQQKLMEERVKSQQMERQIAQGQLDAQQAAQRTASGRSAAMQSGSRGAVLKALEADPEGYERAVKHYEQIDNSLNRVMGSVAAGVRAFGDSPQAATAAIDDLIDQGFDPQRLSLMKEQIAKNPQVLPQLIDSLLLKSPEAEHRALVKKPEKEQPFTLGENQVRYAADGSPIAYGPDKAAPEPKKYTVTVKGPSGGPVTKLVTEEELAKGIEAYREPKDAKEAAKFWVMRDGQPVRVTEAQYRVGDKPSSTREQGRPVTSGDAGRITELTTSLDDLDRLEKELGGTGATGALSKIGASVVPNVVTEYTGLGLGPKQRQALIDRVRQVIGKALEGGVLRKEDEVKYEKILPTIGDPADVVTTKLAGLKAAIGQRKDRTLEALGDAGYDTSKFTKPDVEWERGPDGRPRRKGSQ